MMNNSLLKALVAIFLITNISNSFSQYPVSYNLSNSCGSAQTLNLITANDCSEVGTSAMPKWTSSVNFGSYSNSNTGGNTSPSYDYCEDLFSIVNTSGSPADGWVRITTGSNVEAIIFEAQNQSYSGNVNNEVHAGIAIYESNSCPGSGTSPEQLDDPVRCGGGEDIDNVRLFDKYSSSNTGWYDYIPQVDVKPNTTYYVRVFMDAGSEKNVSFDLDIIPVPSPPSNGNCNNAEVVTQSIVGCNYGAYGGPDAVPSCWFTLENSAYYSITKTNPGAFSVTIEDVKCSDGGEDLQTALFKTSSCSLTGSTQQDCEVSTGDITLYALDNNDPVGTEYILWVDGNAGAVCSWGIIDNNNPPCAAPSLNVSNATIATCATTYDLSTVVTSSGTVTYHNNLSDAQGDVNPISSSVIGTGTYYVRADDGSTCFTTSAISVTFNTNPVAPAAITGGGVTICEGDDVVLTTSGGNGTLTWYSGSCGGTPVGTGTSITVSPSLGTTNYYVRDETVSCGNSACETTSVTVNAAPTLSITQPTACAPGLIDLNSFVTSSGTVSFHASQSDADLGINSIASNQSDAGTYYVRSESGSCFVTDVVYYSGSQITGISISPDNAGPYCEGDVVSLDADVTISQPSNCVFTLRLTDNGADGWGLNNISLYENSGSGNVEVGTYAIASGAGPENYSFTMNSGSVYTIRYRDQDRRNAQNDFALIDSEGNVVFTGEGTNENNCACTSSIDSIDYVLGSYSCVTTYTTDWSGAGVFNANETFTQSNQSLSIGDNVYVITATDHNGCSVTESVTLTANTSPVVTNPGNASVCEGINNFTFPPISVTNANAPAYYSESGGTGTQYAAGQTITVSTLTTFYLYDANGSCSDEEAFTVTPITPPNAGTPNVGPNEFCNSNGVTVDLDDLLTGEDALGNWVAITGGAPIIGAGNIVDLDAVGPGDYVYEYTVNGISPCGNSQSQVTVSVFEQPTITLNGGANCSADLTTYDVSVDVSEGTVTSTEGTVTNNGGNNWTIAGVTAGTDITLTVATANCSNTLAITAPNCSCPTVNPPIDNDNITECEQSPVQTLTATATVSSGESVVWYDAATGGNLVTTPELNTIGSVTYYAETEVDATGCTSITRSPVVLTITGSPTFASGITTSPTDCTTPTGSFEVTGLNPGEEYTIDYEGTEVTLTADINGEVIVTSVSEGTYDNITVTSTLTGCDNSTGTFGAVIGAPIAPTVAAGNDTTICIGEDVILSATASAGTLSWDNSVVDGVAFTPGVIGVFDYVATTDEIGCIARDTVRVTVAGLPTAGITRAQDTICFGDDILLQGSGGVDYSWSTGDQTQDITVSPVDLTPYQLIVTDANGCVDDTAIFITVVDQPIVDILTNGPLAMCVGDTVTLTATGNGDIVWPDGSIGDTYVADGSITPIYATVTALCGNTAQDSLVIVQGVTPAVDAGPDGEIEAGESYEIDATITGDTIFVWTPSNDLSCVDCEDPIASPDSTIIYFVTATSADGCVAYDSVIVTVNPSDDIWWPNAITGTGDDCCFGFTTDAVLDDYYLRIYNRWGELMFESRDQTEFWDGTFRGKVVQTGVYTFVMDYVDAQGTAQTIGGNITVVR